jgi:hypothetical protein
MGVEPGTYSHYADSLHLYDEDAENAFSSSRLPAAEALDPLALPKHDADPIWMEMNRRVDALVANALSPKGYGALARLGDAPQAFSNLMAVVAADAARRRRCIDGVSEAIAVCDNPLLNQLWSRWANRWPSGI